jgi:TonB family protein
MTRGLLAIAAIATIGLGTTQANAQEGARREQQKPAPPPDPVLTKPPELLEGAEPQYPPAAAASGREASVKVRISIDATGAVADVTVPVPVGDGFDEAAIAAARQYKFVPAEFDGKPGPIVIETTIHFVMRVEETPVEPDAPATQATATATIRGEVKERGTRKRLAGVSIGVRGHDAETSTDAQGKFELRGVPIGKARLVVVQPDYDRFETTIDLAADEIVETSVFLRPRGGRTDGTVAVGARDRFEVTKRTLSRRELTTVPGTFGDPIRVIQNLPGLARSPYATGILLIRGSNPDDSGVYIDGHRVPLLFHFLGGPSILNPEFLENIDLYPGGFPTRFGRAHGGVVEVTTRPAASDGFHGAADVDLIDASVYARGKINKTMSLAVAARRSYIDAILPLVLPEPDPGEQLTVVPVYWDYQLRADVDLPGRDTFSILWFGSDDRLKVLQTDEEQMSEVDLTSHIGFHRVIAKYATPIGKYVFSISPVFGRDKLSFAAGEQASTDVTQTVWGVRERLVGKILPNLRLDAGIDLEYRRTDYQAVLPSATDVRGFGGDGAGEGTNNIDVPPEEFARAADAYQLGMYAEVAWDVGKLRLIPGVRFDAYLLSGEWLSSLDPRLVARYQLDGKTALKSYAGVFHQPPQPEAIDTTFGNPNLGVERGLHFGLGVERKLWKFLSIDTEIYYIDRDNLVIFTDASERRPDGTVRPLNYSNEAIGRGYGLELMLKHEVTKNFYGWISYTLSRSEVRSRPDQAYRPTQFDQTHNFVGVASYRTDGGWEFGARFRLTTGRPQTPVLGGTYDADGDDYEPLQGESRSARGATFHELDIRIDKNWVFKTWQLGIYLDIINIYNAQNPEGTQYDYRFRESHPIRGVPFVPTFGVKGQW